MKNYPPRTHMTTDETEEFCRVLRAMPTSTGFIITHCMEPPHTPQMHNSFSAIVLLPGSNGRGDAFGDNPARALLKAWALAHVDAAEKLMPKDEVQK